MQQPERQVPGADQVVARGAGLVLRRRHGVARPRGEPAEALAGIEIEWPARVLGNETLLGCLLGNPHAPADLRPGRARAPCLVDEVADQMVGHFAEVIGGEDGARKLFERVGVHLRDGLDEVVEPDGIRHADWVRHASTVG